jgi:phage-related protein
MTAIPYPEKIHITSDVGIKDDVSIVAFGDGYQQRMENGLNAQREDWSIIYPALSLAELQTALTTLKAAGAVNAMIWTSPLDGLEKKYVVVKDSRRVQKIGIKWRLTLSLQQVFEP